MSKELREYDEIIKLFNPYHDKKGLFTTSHGKGGGQAGQGKGSGGGTTRKSAAYKKWKKDERTRKHSGPEYMQVEKSWDDWSASDYGTSLFGEKRDPVEAARKHYEKSIAPHVKKYGKYRALSNLEDEWPSSKSGKAVHKYYEELENLIDKEDAPNDLIGARS